MSKRYERLNRELLDIVRELEEEGVLDKQFLTVRSLKETSNPFFLAELIPSFTKDFLNGVQKLSDALEKPAVNFHELDQFCLKIKGSSSCFGACRLVQAIVGLRQAIGGESVDLCLAALDVVKQEWSYLETKLSHILKLEIRMICHDDVV
uniref:Histidine-containing phosphotransfer protein n=1 Tax=Kalanchoe fedtschenkoi TaxID=63787 RepID=A0A7N0T669_KALFE